MTPGPKPENLTPLKTPHKALGITAQSENVSDLTLYRKNFLPFAYRIMTTLPGATWKPTKSPAKTSFLLQRPARGIRSIFGTSMVLTAITLVGCCPRKCSRNKGGPNP